MTTLPKHQLSLPLGEDSPARRGRTSTATHVVDDIDHAFARCEDDQRRGLERALTLLAGRRILVTLTDNSSTMLSSHHSARGLVVRLHHMFLEAEPHLVEALAAFLIRGDNASGKEIDAFISEHADCVAPPSPRRVRLRPHGHHHQLAAIFKDINERYFDDQVQCHISWGRNIRRRRRSHMQMGSFNPELNLIRIHPALDQQWVPAHYVSWVVYHEMLHAHLGVDLVNANTGRRMVHTSRFEFAERQYEHYDQARAWEHKNIRRLMRY